MTHWAVKMNRGRRTVHVHAEYHVIEAGVLKFRTRARGNCGYPVNVVAFAPGEWVSVTNLDIEVVT